MELEDMMNKMKFDGGSLNEMQLRKLTQEKFAFYMKLCNMTERVKVFATLFKSRRPFYETNFIQKKEE